ncbi:DNA cytosine methyltransferase [Methylocystis sp. B8]|uniref:DNA cytosine methyltransferase n=1 Tax=Methylocystis sp. B8 TaxID=544938 RepID=UPI0010FDB40A|nr:DNA cytosine methyltransferase [Methylocystis sp. B8]TLG78489.1 DNA cytosine methyltransferase [Methylocystis sp. B8]
MADKPSYYEFFAGGGMARAGLGGGWRCLFANDFDRKKAESYRANWGGEELHVGDVREISTAQLPGQADLVWASFPCQDLSLAGAGAGLKGERSGTFWPFWDLMKALRKEGRAPSLIVLENVCGALTSHGGKDFVKICEALALEGYRFGALVIDASLFVPQSRPRLFIIATGEDVILPESLLRHCERSEAIQSHEGGPGLLRRFAPRNDGDELFHTRALVSAHKTLPIALRNSWLWWNLPSPSPRNTSLIDIIEDAPTDVDWHSGAETKALIAMMSEVNLAKIAEAKRAGRKMVGTLYRRTRYQNGKKIQRAEARFDNIAGCLRTPAGGSSRQYVLVVNKGRVRSRLMSARETARLMGLPDDYILPENYNEAYHLTGDGVVVSVVQYISEHILKPLFLVPNVKKSRDAA